MTDYLAQFPIWSSLSKNTDLEKLAAGDKRRANVMRKRGASGNGGTVTDASGRESTDLWMDGASNQKIASNLRINGKTVYTYKRNIRMKLHMDTRYSRVFIATGSGKLTVR